MDVKNRKFVWIDVFKRAADGKSGNMAVIRASDDLTLDEICEKAKKMVNDGEAYRTMVYVNGVTLIAEYGEA